MTKPRKVHVWAIVRIDTYLEDDGKGRATVTTVLPTREEAAAEVERLNDLALKKSPAGDIQYEMQVARFYPEGRSVQPDDDLGSDSDR